MRPAPGSPVSSVPGERPTGGNLLSVRSLSKRFGGVSATDDVSLDDSVFVRAGLTY